VIEIPPGGPPEYSDEQNTLLTAHLLELTSELHAGAWTDMRADLEWVCSLHRRLFDGVRDDAGRPRAQGRGAERVVFGPNRSAHRDHVEAQMRELLAHADARLRRFDPMDPGYEAAVLELAVRTHADMIAIHPFEDGNGRTSRLVAGRVLVAGGLAPVPIEAAKQEYNAALNLYFATKDLTPLVDLYVLLAPAARRSR
jgi:fido (protein-threonine AMPylation protein)